MKITITKLDEGFTVSVKEGDAIVTKRAFESLNTALSFAERQLGGQPPAEAERQVQPEERLAVEQFANGFAQAVEDDRAMNGDFVARDLPQAAENGEAEGAAPAIPPGGIFFFGNRR